MASTSHLSSPVAVTGDLGAVVAAPPTPHPGRPLRGVARELPVVLLATTLVAALPTVIATRMIAGHAMTAFVASAALAALLSAVTARACAAVWARKPIFADVLFADLMAWTWARRRANEWRLGRIQRRLIALPPRQATMPVAGLARLGRLLEARHGGTYGHSRRVARHAQAIARAMHLEEDEVERIRLAAMVHDIGKIYTPREILDKPGRLTNDEFDVIKRHPGEGADLLTHLEDPGLVAMVRHHHERLDGTGYPDRLAGEQIPLGARIIAVADTFDALTSARPYRPAATHQAALAILDAEAGGQLDTEAVAAFRRHYTASRSAAFVTTIIAGAERALSWLGAGSLGLGGGVASLGQALPAASATALLALGAPMAPITARSELPRPPVGLSGQVASPPTGATRTTAVRGPQRSPSSSPSPTSTRPPSGPGRSEARHRRPGTSPRTEHPSPRPSGPATGPTQSSRDPAATATAPVTPSHAEPATSAPAVTTTVAPSPTTAVAATSTPAVTTTVAPGPAPPVATVTSSPSASNAVAPTAVAVTTPAASATVTVPSTPALPALSASVAVP